MERVGKAGLFLVTLALGFVILLSLQIAFANRLAHRGASTATAVPVVPDPAKRDGVRAVGVSTAEVKIDNFTFTPAALTVPVGTQVTWTNRDDIPHTVVSDDKAIKSKALDTDDKFAFTFTQAGTHTYFCSLHPKMKGKVVVQ
jgi:plastocyanin